MKKQAKIYNGEWIESNYDLPKIGESKMYRHDNGRSVKVSYWNKSEIIVSFFDKDELTTHLLHTYKTLSEASNAILAWNVAYRIY
jgi:hypothetical protein